MPDVHESWGKCIPLESAPDIFDEWRDRLGVQHGGNWQDVYSLDPDALQFFGKSRAIIFSYTATDASHKVSYSVEENEKYRGALTTVWHCEQNFGHICGTMALLHTYANIHTTFSDDSPLNRFYKDTKDDDAKTKGNKLRTNVEIATIHSALAVKGQSTVPDEVTSHYVALLPIQGRIYDLNGGRPYPLDRGPIENGDFLRSAIAYLRRDILPHVLYNELNILSLT